MLAIDDDNDEDEGSLIDFSSSDNQCSSRIGMISDDDHDELLSDSEEQVSKDDGFEVYEAEPTRIKRVCVRYSLEEDISLLKGVFKVRTINYCLLEFGNKWSKIVSVGSVGETKRNPISLRQRFMTICPVLVAEMNSSEPAMPPWTVMTRLRRHFTFLSLEKITNVASRKDTKINPTVFEDERYGALITEAMYIRGHVKNQSTDEEKDELLSGAEVDEIADFESDSDLIGRFDIRKRNKTSIKSDMSMESPLL